MFHRTPEKYLYTTSNVIYGEAELVYSEEAKGWVILGGKVIRNRKDAEKYAAKLDQIIQANITRLRKVSRI